MTRIRISKDSENGTYQWQDRNTPSRVDWTPGYNNVNVVPEPSKGIPDVPLDVDHRHSAPPPLDPRYVEETVGPKGESRPHHGQPALLDPLAPLGSALNPLVIEDDENAKRHRAAQKPLGPPPGLENQTPRCPTQGTSRNATPGPSSASTSSTSSSSRTTRSTAKANAPAPAPAPEPPIGQARYKKTAADGFTPKMSSPLKKVAYVAAPSSSSASSSAITPTPDRWQIPPRKHSTGSVTVWSVSSSDSEYE
ncbi:hypothetical protein C8Q77DRAFT_1071927 [Trametes polyzona]|nr:hypothetical protein C8Q77DRAFT_1071927 [Trametes polyzona]